MNDTQQRPVWQVPLDAFAWLALNLTAPIFLILFLIAGGVILFEEVVAWELVSDWLSREGGAIFNWWLITTLAGAAAFPLLYRLVPGLPSRGYALARTAGLMLTGFIFWFLASLGFLTNDPGSILLAWIMVIAAALAVWTRRPDPQGLSLRAWFREHLAMIVLTEVLFAALLVGWAMYRAHEPEIRSTEKPMEIMFVNSIRQSEVFPPNDGWMAGYSISYYYFGYVITAALADVSGVDTGWAFGMITPLLFALAGVGIFGVIYDLARARDVLGRWRGGGQNAAMFAGLMGTVFLVFMGNLGTFFIEVPWNGNATSITTPQYFDFWEVPERSIIAIDITEPTQTNERVYAIPSENREIVLQGEQRLPNRYTVVPDLNRNRTADFEEADYQRDLDQWGFWWWFRYSRVVNDQYLNGDALGVQPIAEFPQFSFILSDVHPHVLALPFAVLAIGLAAGVALNGRRVEWWGMVLLAIWVGGMVFMNSWDAVYIPLLVGAEALRRLIRSGTGRIFAEDWLGILGFALSLLVLTGVFYFPWIISFASQAKGIYFNIIWSTAPQQLFLQFGAFAVFLMPFLLREAMLGAGWINWKAVLITFALIFILLIVLLPFTAGAFYDIACGKGVNQPSAPSQLQVSACHARDVLFGGVNPTGADSVRRPADFWEHVFNRVFRGADPAPNTNFWAEVLVRRLPAYLSQGMIVLALVIIVYRLFAKDRGEREVITYHPATAVALLIMAAGLVLILVPDFVYLVDNFGVRINTVFKLYYQGWILLSVASGYAVYAMLFGTARRVDDTPLPAEAFPFILAQRLIYAAVFVVFLGISLLYPLYAPQTRGLIETGIAGNYERYAECQQRQQAAEEKGEFFSEICAPIPQLTLNGEPRAVSPDEYAIVDCLRDLNPPPGTVLAEAPFNGGYHMEYGRIATLTGIPNLLGWINHETQWRGDTYELVTETVKNESGGVIDNREMQVDRLYQTSDIEEAQRVIDRYGIDYVIVGGAERSRYSGYPEGLEKFGYWLTPVCPSQPAEGMAVLYKVN